MLSTNQKAKNINEYLHKIGKAQLTKKTLSENMPVTVSNSKELKDLVFKTKNLYDVIIDFKGSPGIIMLVDIIELDNDITNKHYQLFKS